MYVCVCNAITDRDIARAAREGARNVSDLSAALGVATGCGTCKEMAQGLLDAAHGEASPPVTNPGAVYRYVPA